MRALTFDVYGTLVNWDDGVRSALHLMAGLAGLDHIELARRREIEERSLESGAYLPYAEVLRESLKRAAYFFGRVLDEAELDRFAGSIVQWPPFEDSERALAALRTRFPLVAVSNAEARMLEVTAGRLGSPFALMIAADAVRSYKPAPAHFQAAQAQLGFLPAEVLHIAQSLYHDVRPALALGFQVAWVNRKDEPVPTDLRPRWIVRDLETLAAILIRP